MVDFIKSAHKRTMLANVLHALFYIAYAAAVMFLVVLFPTAPWAALGLVVISKWRVVSVRPRYWWANILSNLPDALFGIAIVTLMWTSGFLPVQIALTVFYMIWLIFIKPQHKRHMIMIQAGLSQFLATWALFSIGYTMPLFVVVLLAAVVGFSSARHALSAYEETDRSLLSLVWGLIMAELGFVAWHWTIAYSVTPTLKVPQISIVVAVIAFLAERSYVAWRNDEKITWNEIRWPAIFAAAVLAILLLFFSGLWDASTL